MKTTQKNTLLAILSANVLFFLPVIIADVHYRDDLERSFSGSYGWTELGRPLADWIMKIISLSDGHLVDTSPLPAIISILSITIAIYFYWQRTDRTQSIWIAVGLCAISIQPFFIQNILFKYDVLPMSLAMSFSIMASAMDIKKGKDIALSIILLVASLSLYQSCANVFIGLVALTAILKRENSKSTINDIMHKTVIFTVGYVVYFIITKIFIDGLSSRSELIPLNQDGFHILLSNLISFMSFSVVFVNSTVMALLVVPLLSLLVALIYIDKKSIALSIVNIVLISSIFLCSIFGPLLVLKTPAIMPRTLSGFGPLMAALCIAPMIVKPSLFSKFFLLLSLIIPISLSFSATRAIIEQRNFEKSVFNEIKYDLHSLNVDGKTHFLGTLQLAQRASIPALNNELAKNLISPASEWMAALQLKSIGVKNVSHGYGEENKNSSSVVKYEKDAGLPVIDKETYSIYMIDNDAYIKLK
ncbi:glucosyltransferase domain-containing protein [Enterobacter hormaechei]|uniref:glucosyltransferase domain-containing protein n=1 Tax=Enterobacter hormaechei TaxID=158836 RepID=UPI0029284403|nr:glucosyltransferase domain-containing protein [Enterobacter hormaechei]